MAWGGHRHLTSSHPAGSPGSAWHGIQAVRFCGLSHAVSDEQLGDVRTRRLARYPGVRKRGAALDEGLDRRHPIGIRGMPELESAPHACPYERRGLPRRVGRLDISALLDEQPDDVDAA